MFCAATPPPTFPHQQINRERLYREQDAKRKQRVVTTQRQNSQMNRCKLREDVADFKLGTIMAIVCVLLKVEGRLRGAA